jgi:hypothetical protein
MEHTPKSKALRAATALLTTLAGVAGLAQPAIPPAAIEQFLDADGNAQPHDLHEAKKLGPLKG